MGILDDLIAFFQEQDISITDFYKNFTEPVDSDCVILWNYDGIQTDNGLRPQVQIMVKSTEMSLAETAIFELYNALSPEGNHQKTMDINGKTMLVIPKQSPFYLDKDDKRRHVYVFNVDIITKRS